MRPLVRAMLPLLLLAPIVSLLASRPAHTTPLWAARTGNMCGQCHFDPNGGGPRNDFGFMFARNRHSLAADTTGEWKDLDLTNRVGDRMPVYFGLNQRFMLLANTTAQSDSLDRLGFFNMESAIYITFQPHQKLTLVYSRDGFAQDANSTVKQKDAYGMISGLPGSGYLKIGRFRNPFGLRMDDHTVGTRNGFLDFSTETLFLPYDPRQPDMGVEYGMQYGPLYGRVALTNGDANLFAGQFAETKTIKIGVNHSWYQSGLSFYDDFQKEPGATGSTRQRATRWGYYGLTHYGPFAVIGEVAAGTDQRVGTPGGPATGPRTNLLAGFIEGDYALGRSINVRARYDYLDTDRSTDPAQRKANTHQRYAIESEWVPVPFAELRFAVRRIDHHQVGGLFPYDDENQYFVQAHFSY